MRVYFCILFCVCSGAVFAQEGAVSGRLLDTVSHQVLEGATVRLLHIRGEDTTVVAGTLAKGEGRFLLGHLPLGNFLLTVSFQGYRGYAGGINLSARHPNVQAVLYLRPEASELEGIVVRDTRPVRVHGDTTAYLADQFHTRPNASAGDLINKLPGVDVTRSGTVVAQGDTVKRILVNGKRFFSNNIQVALKYLPRDMIASIEVFDDKSDQAKFTGVDDGVRVRTINILLKKNIRSGLFGKAEASAGLPGAPSPEPGALYAGSLDLHQFKGDRMITLIGGADNTAPVVGGQSRTLNGGLNFSDQWGKTTQVSGSVMGSSGNSQASTSTLTEQLVPGDSSLYNSAQTGTTAHHGSENVNMNLETQVDSADRLTVRISGEGGRGNNNNQASTSSTSGLSTPLNKSVTDGYEDMHSASGSLDVLWGHRFARKGRTLSLAVSMQGSQGGSTGVNQYMNTYYLPGGLDSVASANQYFTAPASNAGGNASLSYTEPLDKHSTLLFNYRYSLTTGRSGKSTFDYDSVHHGYLLPDSLLTNLFSDNYQSQEGELHYHFGSKRLQITGGLGVQDGIQRSRDMSHDTTLSLRYVNLDPLASVEYNPAKGTHFSIWYTGRTSQPTLSELEPVYNNTNPLNVTAGNPHLKQSYTHGVDLSWHEFDPVSFAHLFVGLRGSLTENRVSSVTHIDTLTGVDSTTYANLSGNYTLGLYMDYGLRLKHPASNVSAGVDVSEDHHTGYINGVFSTSANYVLGGTVKWTSNLPDHLDLNMTYNPLYNLGVESALPSANTHYLTQHVDLDGLWFSQSGWELGSVVQYTSYSGRPTGFNTTIAVWNASLAHLFFKHQQGEVKLSVHDLLDESASVNATVAPGMIANTEGKMLGRYYMIGFAYHFKNS